MIKLAKGAAFIATSANTQTSRKVENLVLNFQTSLEKTESGNVGKVGSWLFDEQGTNVMGVQKVQDLDQFAGKDILAELHVEYIAELQALNPNVEFVNTLIK